jgi:integrase
MTDAEPRPVELWLRSLSLSAKSKRHIREVLSQLWKHAQWSKFVALQPVNPMSKVTIRADKNEQPRKPRSLTIEDFRALRELVLNDPCWCALISVAAGLGLRISEVLGLKWKDVDWLNKTINIERGVVKQIVDDVKSAHSARTMAAADDILNVLKQWRCATQFSAPEDWIFASPYKLGRQPLCYTHVWETLRDLAKKAGIEHVSSHCFRHSYRSWLDSVGTPVGVQQKLMRHADIRTTMNVYGDAATDDMRKANTKVAQIAFA